MQGRTPPLPPGACVCWLASRALQKTPVFLSIIIDMRKHCCMKKQQLISIVLKFLAQLTQAGILLFFRLQTGNKKEQVPKICHKYLTQNVTLFMVMFLSLHEIFPEILDNEFYSLLLITSKFTSFNRSGTALFLVDLRISCKKSSSKRESIKIC